MNEDADQICVSSIHKTFVVLELTHRCNFKCPFCFLPSHDNPEVADKEMPPEFWIKLIDKQIKRGASFFQLTGGEPLLSDSLPILIDHFSTTFPSTQFAVYTNMSLLNNELLSALRKTAGGIFTTLPSIANYELATCSRFSFDSWKCKCEQTVSSEVPLSIAITVTKANLFELPKMLQLAQSLKPIAIQVNPMMIEGRAKKHPELWLTYPDVRSIVKTVRKSRDRMAVPIRLVTETYCHCRSDAIIPKGHPSRMESTDCIDCLPFLVISPNGRRRKCMHTCELLERYGDEKEPL